MASPTLTMLKKMENGEKPAKAAIELPEMEEEENDLSSEISSAKVAAVDEANSVAAATQENEEKSAPKKETKEVDALSKAVSELSNLTKTKALNLAKKIAADTEFNLFRLGGVLSMIQSNGWYDEYASFKEFINAEFTWLSNRPYRKSMYLIQIYRALVGSGVKWEMVSALGWTKLSVLAPHLNNDNVADWVEKAKDMTVLQLKDYLAQEANGKETASPPTNLEKSNDASTLTFKVYPDQKEVIKEAVEKAKGEFSTEVDSVAMENLCMAYLGDTPAYLGDTPKESAAVTAKEASLVDIMKTKTLEEVLAAVEEVFPEAKITVEI